MAHSNDEITDTTRRGLLRRGLTLAGDRVTLEIGTSRERLSTPETGAVRGQQVSTVVSGRLGEWMEIGGTTQSMEREEGELLGRSRDARRHDSRVLLRVEEMQ